MTRALVAAVLATLLLTGCQAEGTPTPDPAEPRTEQVSVEFDTLALTLEVPVWLGSGRRENERARCPADRHTWYKNPSNADRAQLTVATTDAGCPDEQALNGRFPAWHSADQLPADAEPVETPVGQGHRFPLKYTECTNECRSFDYTVIFVELDGGRSFWLQATGIERSVLDAVVDSLRLA